MRRYPFLPLLFALAACLAPAMTAAHGGTDGDKSKKEAVHKITQSESYLMIDPIYTSIMDGDRPLGLLMVGIGLDVPNAGLRDEVVAAMPRLRDAYVRNLISYSATSVRPWRQPDVGEIADRLQRITDRMLKQPGARILLAQVAMRLNK